MRLKTRAKALGVAAVGSVALSCGASADVFEYDELGRLIRASYDDCSVVEFAYDPNGNRTSRTVTKGVGDCAYVNQPPVAADDAVGVLISPGSPSPQVEVDVLANDVDPEAQPLEITSITTPSFGIAVIINNGTAVRVQAGSSGVVTFQYTVTDPFGNTDTATVNVTFFSSPFS